MKKSMLVVFMMITVMVACVWEEEVDFTITFISPKDGDVLTVGEQIELEVEVYDPNGFILGVTFFADGNEINMDSTAPYTSSLNTLDLGVRETLLKVEAFDDYNTMSDEIAVSIELNGSVTDVDGNEYRTVIIGDQEWMAENLRVTHFRDGTGVQNISSNGIWYRPNEGGYCYYDNNSANAATYGAVYNTRAMVNSHGLAPEGWHVPTDDEWKQLELFLGMSPEEVHSEGLRGTDQGSMIAGDSSHWMLGDLTDNSLVNSSYLNIFPGGYRSDSDGLFYGSTSEAHLWTSDGYIRSLYNDQTGIYRTRVPGQGGFSIRCVRD